MSAQRVIVAGCVKTKCNSPAPAKALYISQLWRARRAYAEATGLPWMVLSAGAGFISPETVLAPYETRAQDLKGPQLAAWLANVTSQVEALKAQLGAQELVLVVLAGAAYVRLLASAVVCVPGVTVEAPLKGLQLGERKRELKLMIAGQQAQRVAERRAEGADIPPGVRRMAERKGIRLDQLHEVPTADGRRSFKVIRD